jgi:hypothetical protein
MKIKYLLTLVFGLAMQVALADYVNDGHMQYYGRITYIDAQTVKIKLNCNGFEKAFKWQDIMGITFDGECSHSGPSFITSPVTANLNCPRVKVFDFQFKDKDKESFATSLKFDQGKLTITYASGKGTYTFNSDQLKDRIRWMVYEEACRADIPSDFPVLH